VRADRLVAALLVLQARGRVTAAELAEELEISERTARRDLEALAMAGVPIYSQAGRGGGWSLIGGAKTDLSGLSAPEVRALFLLAGPSTHASPDVKAALRKLVRALPETFRAQAEAAASAVMLDASSWDHGPARAPEHLHALQHAIVAGRQVRIAYAGRSRPEGERVVHPLGLVAKRSIWYLVANTDAGLRTFRVDRVRSVTMTDDAVVRPPGFDLAEHWRSVVETVDERRAPFIIRARIVRHAVGWLRTTWGNRVRVVDDATDPVEVELRGYSVEQAARELAMFGSMIEIIEPVELRGALAQLGEEIARAHGRGATPSTRAGRRRASG
jgi:predicted DNA-binding transcriptional regulator YafY